MRSTINACRTSKRQSALDSMLRWAPILPSHRFRILWWGIRENEESEMEGDRVLAVSAFVVFIVSAAASLTIFSYMCAGAWRLWQRIRTLEARLLEIDSRLIAMVAFLEKHSNLRMVLLPPEPDLKKR